MLVEFLDRGNKEILSRVEFRDITPVLLMVRDRAEINLFFGNDDEIGIYGRLCDYEYTIRDTGDSFEESVQVLVDCTSNRSQTRS
ncbi:hypothetical protein [Sutcliffiella horikoshii]|uniref:hypothetical protein n=1 Tax=Sutcliffiella horikoshii TaxID=79883 RepID=UPI001F19BA37|nr:hypothetical protein [Sutcliffiella horikoshii]MCG1020777.1 hypothetical protein [Sutcliffiella horikoshii]